MKKIIAILFTFTAISFAGITCEARLDGSGHYAVTLSDTVGYASVNLEAYHDGFYLGGDLVHHEDRDTLKSFSWISGYNRTFDYRGEWASDTRESMSDFATAECEVVYTLTLEQMKAMGAARDSIRKYNDWLERKKLEDARKERDAKIAAAQKRMRKEALERARIQSEYDAMVNRARAAREFAMDSLKNRVNLGWGLIGLGAVVELIGFGILSSNEELGVGIACTAMIPTILGAVIGVPADKEYKRLDAMTQSMYVGEYLAKENKERYKKYNQEN